MPMFELQGHRGARGLKPENTLPGFEVAFDLGVTSVETDVHLTRDGVPVLFHDATVSTRHCRRTRGSRSPAPSTGPLVSSLTLAEFRGYCADRNPDRKRFPAQDRSLTRLAWRFARQHHIHPYTPPSLADLFGFAEAFADETGAEAGKTARQRERARRVVFDLELKRIPYRPEAIGDNFDGETSGLLERSVVEAVRKAGMIDRTRVRSFDHRAVRSIRRLEPGLSAAVLIAETAPADPASLAKSVGADTYCPDYRFLDAAQVRACHAAGVRVIPWTVNEEADWLRLLGWGVDGLTTDYPDRLAALLRSRGIEF
jgi:glycerophosphoryl diester phosphodiesterase